MHAFGVRSRNFLQSSVPAIYFIYLLSAVLSLFFLILLRRVRRTQSVLEKLTWGWRSPVKLIPRQKPHRSSLLLPCALSSLLLCPPPFLFRTHFTLGKVEGRWILESEDWRGQAPLEQSRCPLRFRHKAQNHSSRHFLNVRMWKIRTNFSKTRILAPPNSYSGWFSEPP